MIQISINYSKVGSTYVAEKSQQKYIPSNSWVLYKATYKPFTVLMAQGLKSFIILINPKFI